MSVNPINPAVDETLKIQPVPPVPIVVTYTMYSPIPLPDVTMVASAPIVPSGLVPLSQPIAIGGGSAPVPSGENPKSALASDGLPQPIQPSAAPIGSAPSQPVVVDAGAKVEPEKSNPPSKLHWVWYLCPAALMACVAGFLIQSHLSGTISLDEIIAIGSMAIATAAIAAGVLLWNSNLSKNRNWDITGKVLGTFVLMVGLYLACNYLQSQAFAGFESLKSNPIAFAFASVATIGSIGSLVAIKILRNNKGV